MEQDCLAVSCDGGIGALAAILRFMQFSPPAPDDHEVFVGVAPEDAGWYLRFRAEWDADDRSIVGGFAVTVPSERASAFTTEIVILSQHRLVEERGSRPNHALKRIRPSRARCNR